MCLAVWGALGWPALTSVCWLATQPQSQLDERRQLFRAELPEGLRETVRESLILMCNRFCNTAISKWPSTRQKASVFNPCRGYSLSRHSAVHQPEREAC